MIITEQMIKDANLSLPLSFYELVNEDGDVFLTRSDIEDLYEGMLDECYPDLMIANFTYLTSRALKEVDPIAYWCGLDEHISFMLEDGWEEIEHAKSAQAA